MTHHPIPRWQQGTLIASLLSLFLYLSLWQSQAALVFILLFLCSLPFLDGRRLTTRFFQILSVMLLLGTLVAGFVHWRITPEPATPACVIQESER